MATVTAKEDRPVRPADSARRSRTWQLAHRPESAGISRRAARTALADWQVTGSAADQIVLVVSELVTNAVEHAQPPIALRLEAHTGRGYVRVEVDDGGPATREGAWTASCAVGEHGRGNGIIGLLATDHGSRARTGGVTYWADLSTEPCAEPKSRRGVGRR
ncbi:ATP-binding protein [Kitasatospora sp. NPDC001603]|uniref:ATP-binding protein n=1 Tax=Kitasatospora sp. NPDC001603 TaxID=3154388 RepID=UPI00331FCE2C